MKTLVINFLREERGQDLIEYTLLLAFVCLASAGLFTSVGTSLVTVWSNTSTLAASAAAASS